MSGQDVAVLVLLVLFGAGVVAAGFVGSVLGSSEDPEYDGREEGQ